MHKRKTFVLLISLLSSATFFAQDDAVIREYIVKYKDLAIAEMQRTGIPASVKLAQGIHETGAGTSDLVLRSNNHFGLKCKSEWKGMSVKHTDDAPNECFRKYASPGESYTDQSDYLKNSPRYASLFALDPLDYKGWATGLKRAGYATNPRYAPVLIKLIEDYQLQDYTLIAMGKKKESDLASNKTKLEQEKSVSIAEPGPIQPEKKPEETNVVIETPKPVYPSGEFKINETKVVYISKGTSYLSVATQYNIPLARIFEFNDMPEKEAAEKDQLIYLMRKRKTGNEEFHVVKPGESLHDIAQIQALRIESLLEYNYLTEKQKPAIGEKLFLKTKAPAPPALAINENNALTNFGMAVQTNRTTNTDNMVTPVNKTEIAEHTVAAKETIYSIARRYQVKIEDIVKWNNLASYDLKTGQQLKIQKQ